MWRIADREVDSLAQCRQAPIGLHGTILHLDLLQVGNNFGAGNVGYWTLGPYLGGKPWSGGPPEGKTSSLWRNLVSSGFRSRPKLIALDHGSPNVCAFLRTISAIVLTCAMLSWLQPKAHAQEPCGNLPEPDCARLIGAISSWNEVFGETALVKDFSYIGPVESSDVEEAIDGLLDPDSAWFPEPGPERNIVIPTKLSEVPETEREVWEPLLREDLRGFLSGGTHSVELEWVSPDASFTTLVYVGDGYPNLYGNMLSNVALTETSNSCVNRRIRWIWGSIRGEVIIDLAKFYSGGRQICQRRMESWMSFGMVQGELGDIEYEGETCSFPYAYGWVTPFANLAFNSQDFMFEVSGIGSSGRGAGDCAR